MLLGDAAAVAVWRLGIGAPILHGLLLPMGLLIEAATLAAFVPWAARHWAWHFADYALFLALLPRVIAARVRGTDATAHRASFASASAQRRADLERRTMAARAAWRADEALRRHSAKYAESGARIEAAPMSDGGTDLRLRFSGGVPHAAAEAAFREHATWGLPARAAGVSSGRASSVERPDGTLALRLAPAVSEDGDSPSTGEGPPSAETVSAAPARPLPDDVSPLGPGLPPLSLLAAPPPPPAAEDGAAIARRVVEALAAQGTADVRVMAVRVGPTVTVVVVRPPNGPAAARILRLTEDLRFRLGESGLMIRRADGFAGCAAIEVPNVRRAIVALRSVMAATRAAKGDLMAPLGVATDGSPAMTDIADWPHGLVAGATGAGKSVYVNATLVALFLRYTPAELRLLLIDPKRVEFRDYRDLPHLLRPIVADPGESVSALEDAVSEMKRRYILLEKQGARKMSEYNAAVAHGERLPRLLVVIDEAQAIMQEKENAERVITASKDLAAMGRAAGVHLLYGTQYPLATTIPSALKANTPTRIALQQRAKVNSMVVLDQTGAEALLGAGDMLVCVGGGAELRRLQSAFISTEDLRAVVEWWRTRAADGGGDGGEGAHDGADDDATRL